MNGLNEVERSAQSRKVHSDGYQDWSWRLANHPQNGKIIQHIDSKTLGKARSKLSEIAICSDKSAGQFWLHIQGEERRAGENGLSISKVKVHQVENALSMLADDRQVIGL